VRRSHRFREHQLDPSHTYIKEFPLQVSQDINTNNRSRSPKLSDKKLNQPSITQSATEFSRKK
jgi:hypothetical protein